jgi:hypothetical protein
MRKLKKRQIPQVGKTFSRYYKGVQYEMVVVKIGDNIGYKVDNIIYSSLSGAAKSITKSEINGWKFWRVNED